MKSFVTKKLVFKRDMKLHMLMEYYAITEHTLRVKEYCEFHPSLLNSVIFSGVNSGVMLMNLTRMRAFSWTSYVVPIYKEYKLKITWGDQDIINIIFHFHPGNYVYY